MWIVALDKSGSMAEPFSATTPTARRLRTTNAETKWAAAIEVLMEDLAGQLPDLAVAVYVFDSQPTLVFSGRAADRATLAATLAKITAGGGTNIAAALDAVAAHKKAAPAAGLTTALLLTDGKSNRLEAAAAARRCHHESIRLALYLIDPTSDGELFTQDVVAPVEGTWTPVTSRRSLAEGVRSARDGFQEELARADQLILRSRAEAASVEKARRSSESVFFTATFPGRIQPDYDFPLDVYVHVERLREEVTKRIAAGNAKLGPSPRRSEAEASGPIPVGASIEITPRIARVACNPAQQIVTWFGELEQVSFRIHDAGPAGERSPRAGFIDVTTSGLLIAQIPVSITPDDETSAASVPYQWHHGQMFTRIFGSYAHEDRAVVLACQEAYRALGIQLFVDAQSILSGERWNDVIKKSIGDHQLFQLFWSKASSESENVANEWDLALALQSERGDGFIRPVYWSKPMPAPPRRLGGLHFGYLDLAKLDVRERAEVPTPARPPDAHALEASFPIMPVAPCPPGFLAALNRALARIVPLLENVIDGRYYPPPTFVVDAHTVTAVRAIAGEVTPEPASADFEALRDLLRSMAIAFHVGEWVPAAQRGPEQRRQLLAPDGGEVGVQYDHVNRVLEWIFGPPFDQVLTGKRPLPHQNLPVEQWPGNVLGATADLDSYLSLLTTTWVSLIDIALTRASDETGEVAFKALESNVRWLQHRYPNIPIELDKLWSPGGQPDIRACRMRLSDYRAAVAALSGAFLERLPLIRSAGQTLLPDIVGSYGVFLPGGDTTGQRRLEATLKERGWPKESALAGQPKVLVCADALAAAVKRMTDAGMGKDSSEDLSWRLATAVLAHEHFHAAAACALNSRGHAPLGSKVPQRWQEARRLNEALASWTERHLFRDDAEVLRHIDGHIDSGAYPVWPYAGARTVEQVFTEGGLPAVRRMIAFLRADPENAQRDFDLRSVTLESGDARDRSPRGDMSRA